MDKISGIVSPTIILNSNRVKENIAALSLKASTQNIRFRPHFKTHQSATIGDWFKGFGVTSITVSSVKMALYFANNGWKDILIAFPINIRELNTIKDLASKVHLGLLIDDMTTANVLSQEDGLHADLWIKIDTGMGRAGIHWNDHPLQLILARLLNNLPNLRLRGLLTHAGQTYHARSTNQIIELYHESIDRMNECRRILENELALNLEVSVGDTPGCWLANDLGNVDEVRPGNFLFFDSMMYRLGVCKSNEIGLCVACPVISKYDNRNEVLIFGGAVHLSKEVIENSTPPNYGYAVLTPESSIWELRESNYVRSLSQEHGIVKLDRETYNKVSVGDLIYIIPVHSCLVVSALGRFFSPEKEKILVEVSI